MEQEGDSHAIGHLSDNTGTQVSGGPAEEKAKGRLGWQPCPRSVDSPRRTEDGGLQKRNEVGRLSEMFVHLENNITGYFTDTTERVEI